jgi:L-threonylcarbamoyladenylate synthase
LRSQQELRGAPDPRASGTLEAHYAPGAPVRLMDAKALQTALDLLGADAAPHRHLVRVPSCDALIRHRAPAHAR